MVPQDTAGSERYHSIGRQYYRNAMGVLLCYDVGDEASFQKILDWREMVKRDCLNPDVVMLLVSTKGDTPAAKRQVSPDEGAQLARDNEMGFFETSALDASSVREAFSAIASQILVQGMSQQPPETLSYPAIAQVNLHEGSCTCTGADRPSYESEHGRGRCCT